MVGLLAPRNAFLQPPSRVPWCRTVRASLPTAPLGRGTTEAVAVGRSPDTTRGPAYSEWLPCPRTYALRPLTRNHLALPTFAIGRPWTGEQIASVVLMGRSSDELPAHAALRALIVRVISPSRSPRDYLNHWTDSRIRQSASPPVTRGRRRSLGSACRVPCLRGCTTQRRNDGRASGTRVPKATAHPTCGFAVPTDTATSPA